MNKNITKQKQSYRYKQEVAGGRGKGGDQEVQTSSCKINELRV